MREFKCTFCQAKQELCYVLVSGPKITEDEAVCICDKCILISLSILEEQIEKSKKVISIEKRLTGEGYAKV